MKLRNCFISLINYHFFTRENEFSINDWVILTSYLLCHWTDCISLLSIIAWRNFAAVLAEGTSKNLIFGVPSIKTAAKFRQATMLNKEMQSVQWHRRYK